MKYTMYLLCLCLIGCSESEQAVTARQPGTTPVKDTATPSPIPSSNHVVYDHTPRTKPITEWTNKEAAYPSHTPSVISEQESMDVESSKKLIAKIDRISAKYADSLSAYEQKYAEILSSNSEKVMRGEMTPGGYDYAREEAKIAKLQAQINVKKAIQEEMQREVYSDPYYERLRQKYNIPANAGAETLGAIARRIR